MIALVVNAAAAISLGVHVMQNRLAV